MKNEFWIFFDSIFRQGPKLALRRGEGQRMEWYREQIKIVAQFQNLNLNEKLVELVYLQNLNLSKRSIKIATFANTISQKWRTFKRSIFKQKI